VTALAPVMQRTRGAWVGWAGKPDVDVATFEADGVHIWPVSLTEEEVAHYYEGLSNGTLWPLYHDVIVPPEYHRTWWNSYVTVNRRFAAAAAKAVAPGGTVWVHDYQLQLVPSALRALRPDVRIGFFNHIPFPALEIFSQLPWRSQIIEGLLGADLIGFQRRSDAANFRHAVRRFSSYPTRGHTVTIGQRWSRPERTVHVGTFAISIDSHAFDSLAASPAVQRRAAEIRRELGDPEVLLLGVDRLDYTKGIRHRLKAVGELFQEARLVPPEVAMVQIASPSRERVDQYIQLRDEIELTVGRINGDYGVLGRAAIYYMHHSYPAEEMAAMYLAADVMLVTSLRDGMNLVAKEYVAARHDEDGVLVLSEFTGAADELRHALLINPHDIDGMKWAIMRAVNMDRRERRRRMRTLRRRVMSNDVQHWAEDFLAALKNANNHPNPEPPMGQTAPDAAWEEES
ncbi:MAG TPA: trehalose-6-phosphate synthase, partial [Actinomycetaceae bacterium]|nr:trehalose-6-phosphate synthase [Actinomycetaceae bacterium]